MHADPVTPQSIDHTACLPHDVRTNIPDRCTTPRGLLRLFRVAAIGGSILASCILIELIIRSFETSGRRAEAIAAWESDPVYALRYTKGFPTIDGNTFANVRPFTLDSRATRIAFIGDSYIDGNTLHNPELSLPAQVERRLRLRPGTEALETMNFGLSSTGPVHYYIRYTRIVRLYKPRIVVIALHDNDVFDTSEFNRNPHMKPILRRDPLTGEILSASFAQSPSKSALRHWLRKSAVYRWIRFRQERPSPMQRGDGLEQQLALYVEPRGPDTIEAENQFQFWTMKLAEAIRNDGARSLFIYLPAQQCVITDEGERVRRLYQMNCQFDRFDRRLTDWMSANTLPFISFLAPLKLQNTRRMYLPQTVREGGGLGHLGAEGNDFVARELEPILLDLLSLKCRAPAAPDGKAESAIPR